jgi:lectin-like protein
VITGPRDEASRVSGVACGARVSRGVLVFAMLSASACTLTSDEYQPHPVGEVETNGAGSEAPPLPGQPAGNTERPLAPVLTPGEVEPPFDLAPDEAEDENAGGTRSSDDGANALDAGADASDAGDAGSRERDAGSAGADAGAAARDAGTQDPDAGVVSHPVDASSPPHVPDASPPPRPPCPGLVFEGSCYQFFSDQLSWYTAEERCVAWGGHLASVESFEEDAFLGAWPALVGIGLWDGSGLWLGGTDAAADGDFRWWDGRTLSYAGWASDQPNDGQGVDCIEKRNDPTQRWYDRRCSDGERFVCERPD